MNGVREVLRAGADKVAINTAAVQRPELTREVAHVLDSQYMVLSIEVERHGKDHWEVYTDNGREHTGLNVVERGTGVASVRS